VTAIGLDASGTGDNNLNLLETFNNSGSFEAAKITVFTGVSGPGTSTRSTITRLNYKKRAGNSYTYPFGATGTAPNDHEQTKAVILAAAIAAKDATDATNSYNCSFKPERFAATNMSISEALTPSIILLPDLSKSEIETHVRQLYSAAYSLRNFLDGQISEEEWLEAVEATGLNMDEYLQVAIMNSDLICNQIEQYCYRVNVLI
jgi:hypothetical protein